MSTDSVPSWRSSQSSWTSSHTTRTSVTSVSSPRSATFPHRGSKFPPPPPKSMIAIFKRLPQEVYDNILEQLHVLHADSLSPSCATCYMRDLVSLQLTCRAWDKAVRARLYDKIHIIGNDSPQQLKKYKVKIGSRLKLLRRTLRERRMLAHLVHELKVPDVVYPEYSQDGRINPQYKDYVDLVASVVMACPKLERLVGFYQFYGHKFDRLTHALSTRKKLKEKVWIISANEEIADRAHNMLPPGLMDPLQTFQFLHYHSAWESLETLMLLSADGRGIIEHDVFVDVFQLLPSLKHLTISSFDADDFTDRTLLSLPNLVSLRLEHLPGVTDTGLSRWASSPSAQSIESLSLIHQNITSLLAVSKLFASLPSLLRFKIVQSQMAPSLPKELLVFQPLLASPSLRFLHWDVASPNSLPTVRKPNATSPEKPVPNLQTPNTHLALSILHSGFPSLQNLRAPLDIDPPGALQGVCRPTTNAQILLPADRYSLPPSSNQLNGSMPTSLPGGNSLHMARIRAQSFIDVAAKGASEFIKVIVTDHSDREVPYHPRLGASSDPGPRKNAFLDTNEAVLAALYPSGIPSRHSSNDYTTEEEAEAAAERADVEKELAFGDYPSSETSTDSVHIEPQSLNVRVKLTRTISEPVKVQEFSLPAFVGRISTSAFSFAPQPPRFNLLPDIPGYDADGGAVGWADLLRKPGVPYGNGERSVATGMSPAWIRDGCSGQWNRQHRGGPSWWGHTERERRGVVVTTKMFF